MAFCSFDDEVQRAFQECSTLYCEAEKAIKSTEIKTLQGLSIPAVNQLRYAGQHITRISSLSDKKAILQEIESAKSHSKRAIYEAYDAAFLHYFKEFRMFNEEFKAIPIIPSYPGYIEDKANLRRLMDDIATENRENGEKYVEQKERQLAVVKDIANKCNDAREELNKQKFAERTNAKRFLITLIMGGGSLLIAIAALVVAIAAWQGWGIAR